MERSDYEGGLCPCCSRARTEYYVERLWTCSACDSWLVGVGHGWTDSGGRARWEALGRYPLGPLDDVADAVRSLTARAISGRLGAVRAMSQASDE